MAKMVWIEPPRGDDGYAIRDENDQLPPGTGWQERESRAASSVHAIGSGFEPVRCPNTGELIRNDKQMRELALNTGQRLNSKEELIEAGRREVEKRRNPNPTPTARERRDLRDRINDSIERASSSGYTRRVNHE